MLAVHSVTVLPAGMWGGRQARTGGLCLDLVVLHMHVCIAMKQDGLIESVASIMQGGVGCWGAGCRVAWFVVVAVLRWSVICCYDFAAPRNQFVEVLQRTMDEQPP